MRTLGILAAIVSLPTLAWAQPQPPPVYASSRNQGGHISLTLGSGGSDVIDEVGGGNDADEVIGVGVDVLHRSGNFLAGATLDARSSPFGPTSAHVGGVIGLVDDLGDRAWYELAAEGGVHGVSNIGSDLFVESTSGDTNVGLLYLGVRASLHRRIGARGLVVGLWAALQRDMGQAHATVTSTSCFLGCSTDTREYAIGGSELLGGLSIGWASPTF